MDGSFQMSVRKLLKALLETLRLNSRFLLRKVAPYKSVVEKYPDSVSSKAAADMFSNYRGYVRNDLTKCNGCGVCVPVCPVKALEIDATSRSDGSIDVREFRINLGKCFSCNACIDVCPESSLFYSREFELTSSSPQDLILTLRGQPSSGAKDITRIRTYEVRR